MMGRGGWSEVRGDWNASGRESPATGRTTALQTPKAPPEGCRIRDARGTVPSDKFCFNCVEGTKRRAPFPGHHQKVVLGHRSSGTAPRAPLRASPRAPSWAPSWAPPRAPLRCECRSTVPEYHFKMVSPIPESNFKMLSVGKLRQRLH